MSFEAKVPDNFKIVELHEEIDGELMGTMSALKVGKKLAVPDMHFFDWKKNADGTLEGTQDDKLMEKIWGYYPMIDHKIEIL